MATKALQRLIAWEKRIGPKTVRGEVYLSLTIMAVCVLIVAAEVWIVSQGFVMTKPAKQLIGVIGLGTLGPFLVAFLILITRGADYMVNRLTARATAKK